MFSIIWHYRYLVKLLLDIHVFDIQPNIQNHQKWKNVMQCTSAFFENALNKLEEILLICYKYKRLSDGKSTTQDWVHGRRRDLVRDQFCDGCVSLLLLEDVSTLWVVLYRGMRYHRDVEVFLEFDHLPNRLTSSTTNSYDHSLFVT